MRIRNYTQLRKLARGFADGTVRSVAIVGAPGVGKSETIVRVLRHRPHVMIRGRKSAIDFYIQLFLNRDKLIVLDDAEGLLADPAGRELVRDLTEHVGIKTLRWGTQSRVLTAKGVPSEFDTRSRLLILTNRLQAGEITEAISNRIFTVNFDPTWAEVYRHACTWIKDQEILDFVFDHLDCLKRPTLRVLNKAKDAKALAIPGVPWQSVFEEHLVASKTELAARQLLRDPRFVNDAERSEEFERLGHGHAATFYRNAGSIKAQRATVTSIRRFAVGRQDEPVEVVRDNTPPGAAAISLSSELEAAPRAVNVGDLPCS